MELGPLLNTFNVWLIGFLPPNYESLIVVNYAPPRPIFSEPSLSVLLLLEVALI